jgi:hypothetical protein
MNVSANNLSKLDFSKLHHILPPVQQLFPYTCRTAAMDVQLVGAAALGAAGATAVLTALAQRGAAPWLRNRSNKAEPANGNLHDSQQSAGSKKCVQTPCLC